MILLSCNIFDFRKIDDVDKTMEEINQQTDNMRMIQEALSAPLGPASYIDEVTFPNQMIIYVSLDCTIHTHTIEVIR